MAALGGKPDELFDEKCLKHVLSKVKQRVGHKSIALQLGKKMAQNLNYFFRIYPRCQV